MILSYVLQDLPSLSEREPFGDISEFPLFFGTTLFAIEAVGVVVALENNMKTPKSFGARFGVLNIGMVVITLYVFNMRKITLIYRRLWIHCILIFLTDFMQFLDFWAILSMELDQMRVLH